MAEAWDCANYDPPSSNGWDTQSISNRNKESKSPCSSVWGNSPPSSTWGDEEEPSSFSGLSSKNGKPTKNTDKYHWNKKGASENNAASDNCDGLNLALERKTPLSNESERGRGNPRSTNRPRGQWGTDRYRGNSRVRGRGGGWNQSGSGTEIDHWGRVKKGSEKNNNQLSRGRSNYHKSSSSQRNTGGSDSEDNGEHSWRGNKSSNKPHNNFNRNYRTDSETDNRRSDQNFKNGRNFRGQRGGNRHCSTDSETDNNQNYNNYKDGRKNQRGNGRDYKNSKETKIRNVPNTERTICKMSARKLKSLLEKTTDPDEVMLTLKSEINGFGLLLKDPSIQLDMVADILELLEKACHSSQKLNLLQLLGLVTDSNFLARHIPDFLVEIKLGAYENNPRLTLALNFLVIFLSVLPEYQPAFSLKSLSMIIPQLNSCIDCLLDREVDLDLGILDEIKELEDIYKDLATKFKNKDLKKQADTERQHATKPPDSFYDLNIFPSQEELNSIEKPYLRCNIHEGQYVNVEHYLDTQFRLMREDFVRPLREGIREYKIQKMETAGKRVKIQGLYIYDNVFILDPKCGLGGIYHVIKFGTSKLGHVDWRSTKRFFPGSLVCLSSDNFETILFATVAKRDPYLLERGIVNIHFQEKNDKVKKLTPNDPYVMIESSAFFEAYYHNLVAMQNLTENNLPLKDYIVYVERELKPPKYLTECGKVTYDIRPLLLPFPEKKPPSEDFFGEDKISDNKDIYKFNRMHDYVEEIPILDEKKWPPHYDLNLDEFQLKALQLALTKEFVMIQGPPGTGKTYIGLRIVQLLLFNSELWTGKDEAPILIVCFTNHALDQFLEGLLHFTRSMIRVGGRCESKELENYRIMAKRKELKDSGKTPRHIRTNKGEIGSKLAFIQGRIDKADKNITRALHDIITEDELEKYMLEKHVKSLKYDKPQTSTCDNDEKLILDWLQLRFRGSYSEEEMEDDEDDDEEEVNIQTGPSAVVPKPSYSEVTNSDKPELENDGDDFFEDPAGYNEDLEALEEIENEILKTQAPSEDVEDESGLDPDSKVQRRKRRKMLQTRLKIKNKQMDQAAAEKVENIWKLQINERWRLYLHWISKFVTENHQEMYDLHEQYENQIKLLKELIIQEDAYIIKGCKILGMTTTGAAKNQKLLELLKPKIVIVEEAAEVSESHIITALNEKTQQLILIGDHQQLRPNQASYSLAQEHGIDVSLFERMVKNNVYFQTLVSQHRMRPCIANLLVPTIYKQLSNSKSVSEYESVKGVGTDMYFVTHNYAETQEKDSVSRINYHEAEFITKLAKYFVNQGYEHRRITVLTTYSAQVFVIMKMMEKANLDAISVKSVDNYQGEENDIILISFVRSNAKEMVGFLKVHNRVCVALSRARKGLYCIGNFDMLASQSDLWKDIVAKLDDRKARAIGADLKLICQNHPETFVEVRNPEDFDKVPEGGCTRRCNYRMSCGHACPRMCHPYDQKHELIQCKVICNKKTCKEGHLCRKKCFQCQGEKGCGECIALVSKEMPCGHKYNIPCYKDPDSERCHMSCGKTLNCGHLCTKQCFEPCDTKCTIPIQKNSACGHNVKIECCKSEDRFELLRSCINRCSKDLICGDECPGRCGTCKQGSLHQACNKSKCKRAQVCGHDCQHPCAKSCPPCAQKCGVKCSHSQCSKLCGIPCEPCAMRCDWQCPHKKCTKLCGELCNRTPCLEPCPKKLKCKHPCIGLCGEKCPKQCLICDKEDVTEIFFGTEDQENARFVQLNDCGCIFESTALDTWAKSQVSKENVIRILRCPKCVKVIHQCNYLGKYIKSALFKIEKVKEKYVGMRKDNKKKLKQLQISATNLYQKVKTMSSDSGYNFKALGSAINTALSQAAEDNGKLAAMENYINFLDRMNTMDEALWAVDDDILNSTKVYEVKLKEHLRYLQINLVEFMIESCQKKTPTQQQVDDINCELNRLNLIGQLCICAYKGGGLKKLEYNKPACKQFKSGLSLLLEPKKLDTSMWEQANEYLIEMKKFMGLASLGISEKEKKVIITAVGLSQGHWYQCPNGHVYCIGECGGAMQVSRCNECGSKIGGTNHALEANNIVASEMDGAQNSAWSEAVNANMQLREEFLD